MAASASATKQSIDNEIKQHLVPESLQRLFDVKDIVRSSNTIHVLQWNVLAQALSYTKNNFVRVSNDMVNFEKRKWRILEQIIIRQPDMCSLEEMDIFDCFLRAELPKYGYTCYFVPKVNSKCYMFTSDTENFKGPDGTLLCYKTDLFNEISRDENVLPDDGLPEKQVFAVLHLKHKSSKKEVVFIGSHFKAKKYFNHLRTLQSTAVVDYLKQKFPTTTHVIIAGDFNGNYEEPFYSEFVNFGLQSAYRTKMNDSEPPFTTWSFKGRDGTVREQCDTIDYIFYKPEGFTPTAVLKLPEKSDIGPNGLPSANYPSDHLALEVIFNIK